MIRYSLLHVLSVGLLLVTASTMAGCLGSPHYASRLANAEGTDVEVREKLIKQIKRAPADVGAVIQYADKLSRQDEDRAQASALVDRAIELKQDGHLLAYRAMMEPDPARAATLAREAIDLNPDADEARYALGYALSLQGRLAEAENALEDAQSCSQHDPRILRLLAVVQLDAGKPAAAVGTLEMALLREVASSPSSCAWFWYRLAELYDRDPSWIGAGDRLRSRVVVPEDFDLAENWPPLDLPEGPMTLPRPFDERSFLGVTFESGGSLTVDSVCGGSTAESCGVAKGDEFVALNDYDVRTHSDTTATLEQFRGGDDLTIRVRREGQLVSLSGVLVTQAERINLASQGIATGEAAFAKRQYLDAYEAYRTVTSIVGYNLTAAHGQMACAYYVRDFSLAVRLARAWLKVAPGDWRYHEMLIAGLYALGEHTEAQTALEKARCRFPANGRFDAIEGNWEMNASDEADAKRHFERAFCLGNGGAPLYCLANRIDEDIKRKKEQANRLALAMMLGVVLSQSTSSSGSGGSGLGSPPAYPGSPAGGASAIYPGN